MVVIEEYISPAGEIFDYLVEYFFLHHKPLNFGRKVGGGDGMLRGDHVMMGILQRRWLGRGLGRGFSYGQYKGCYVMS